MPSIKSIYVLCKIEKDNHWNRYVAAWIRFHHCLRWGMSEWQLPVQSVMGVWSEWRGFSFRWCVMRLEPLVFVFNYIFFSFTDLNTKKRYVSSTGVEETKCGYNHCDISIFGGSHASGNIALMGISICKSCKMSLVFELSYCLYCVISSHAYRK